MKNFKKLDKLFWKVIALVTFVLLGCIAFKAGRFTLFHRKPTLNCWWKNGMVAYVTMSLVVCYGFFCISFLRSSSERKKKVYRALHWSVILLGQCVILFICRNLESVRDAIHVSSAAQTMLETGILDNSNGYFGKYPNNYGITIFLYYIYLFLKQVGVQNYLLVTRIINVFGIDLGIYFACKIAGKLGKNNYSDVMLLLCTVNPITYLWGPWVYTNTLSIPFAFAIVYIWLCAKEMDTIAIGRYIAIGILSAIGYTIRPTIIIITIAIVMVEVGELLRGKRNKKVIASSIAIYLLTFLLSMGGLNAGLSSHLTDPEKSLRYPITHWIMMGLSDNGTYNQTDIRYTHNLGNYQKKSEGTTKMIKKRIVNYTPYSLAKHQIKKICYVFAIGHDGFSIQKRNKMNYNRIQAYIFGEKNDIQVTYCDAFRALEALLAMVAVMYIFFHIKEDSRGILLILFGALCFFSIWEANIKYNISFQYFMVLLEAIGITCLHKRSLEIENHEQVGGKLLISVEKWMKSCWDSWNKYLRVILVATNVICMLLGILVLFDHSQHYKRVLIEQEITSNDYLKSRKADLGQSFVASQPFDEITLYGPSKFPENAKLNYQILDNEHRVIRSGAIEIKRNQFYAGRNCTNLSIQFKKIEPIGTENYYVILKNKKKTPIKLRARKSKTFDFYSGGTALKNGKQLSADLVFQVSEGKEEWYMYLSQYICLFVIVISVEYVTALHFNSFNRRWRFYKRKRIQMI